MKRIEPDEIALKLATKLDGPVIKGCKHCFGRGHEGWDIKRKALVYCRCVKKNLQRIRRGLKPIEGHRIRGIDTSYQVHRLERM
jgi:hypothetical protein